MPKTRARGRKKSQPTRIRKQTQPDCAGLARLPVQNPNPVLECDTAGQIIYANPAAERLLKTLSPASLLPANFSQLVQRCLREGKDITGQESQAGDRTLLWSLHPAAEGDRIYLYAADITARKRAEKELRLTQFSINHTSDAAFWFGPDARFFYANDAACLSLGYLREELLSMTVHDIDLDHPAESWAETWNAIKQARSRTFESRHRTKAGREFPVEITVNYLQFGGQEYVSAFARDITERKRAEDELRLSEERFRKIFDHSHDAIFVADPARGQIIDVNSKACDLLQFTREELLSKNMSDIHPHEVPRLLEFAESVKKLGYARTEELTCLTKAGQSLAAEICASFMSDVTGEPCMVAFVRDITERLEAEKKLEERRTYLHALIENSPMGIVVVDPENRVQMCNPAFERIFLYRGEEIVGSHLDDLVVPPELESEAIQLTQRVMAGETLHATTRRRRKDGSLVDVTLYALPLTIKGEHVGSYALYNDITDRVALEDQLRQAQKMEAVGRLAGGVAHDFNNMLMVIKGYSELLLSRLTQDDPLYTNSVEIKKAADRATSLTQQLLAFSRKQMLQPKVLNLNTVVAEMDKMLRRLIGEDIELTTQLGPELGQVKADPGQLEQVLLNLAVNARDAMPQGGKLTIETASVELDQDYASRHSEARPGPHVMLAVSDTGCGMDSETRAHIFEPFFTTKEKEKGTGLGLATIYGIVRQSGGNIWVYSEPGRGTTFKVYLPRVEEKCQETGAADAAELEDVSALGTVLVVEDEEGVRKLACEFLRSSGYTVLDAPNGAEALQVSERHRGPIHVMVTDVVMPGMSGRALAAALEPLRPEMQVLYVSGYTENAIVHHGVIDRGTSFLQKPVSLGVLVKRVEELIEAGGLRSNGRLHQPQNMRQKPAA